MNGRRQRHPPRLDPTYPIIEPSKQTDYNLLALPGYDLALVKKAMNHPGLYRNLKPVEYAVEAMLEMEAEGRFRAGRSCEAGTPWRGCRPWPARALSILRRRNLERCGVYQIGEIAGQVLALAREQNHAVRPYEDCRLIAVTFGFVGAAARQCRQPGRQQRLWSGPAPGAGVVKLACLHSCGQATWPCVPGGRRSSPGQ